MPRRKNTDRNELLMTIQSMSGDDARKLVLMLAAMNYMDESFWHKVEDAMTAMTPPTKQEEKADA